MHFGLPRMTRRRFFSLLGGGTALAAGLGVYAFGIEPHWVEVVRRDLPIRNLPEALVGKTLVQLSDLHVGPRVDPDFLTRSLELVNELQPDLIAFTGDFMTCDGDEQVDEVARVLRSLTIPRLGCFAVLGNHDYGNGWSQLDVAGKLVARLDELGIQTLRNVAASVEGLRIIGLDDLWSRRLNTAPLAAELASEEASVVLCHNPDACDRPIWCGYQGWILSGHTHGGQCKAPFLPPPILPVQNKRYTSGAFELHQGRWLYINRALGYLRRVRFNVRPEVTQFRLVRQA